ncbi:hypothetical protein ACFVTX_12975 [Agromyces sp. NPDC058136]|uniref:hypothetical protein n=1 Tax=Agromyces sp. NPDC058136 TaxID=3346354 RepID=UPI0036D9D24E
MRNTRALRVAATVVGALALTLGAAAMPAQAAQPSFICEPLDSGKIDTVGSPATVTATAPDGKLIDGYCVKAGTTKYFVPVEPPQKTVEIDHPDKDSVSHYSVSYTDLPGEPEPGKLPIPAEPAWVDECGTESDGYAKLTDSAEVVWTTSEIGEDGEQTVTATAQGGKVFTDGRTKVEFSHVFTDEECETPPLPQCAAFSKQHSTDLTKWDLSQTRATGHNEIVANGLRIWTEGATSTDKAAGYFDTKFPLSGVGATSIADALDYTATVGIEPGLQLVIDADGDGTNDGILVGEAVYGENWWLSNSAADVVKAGAPNTGGGYGSEWFGTAAEWVEAFPDAIVESIGYSLGSGVHGDGVITKISLGCVEYTFGLKPRESVDPSLDGTIAAGICIADAPWIFFHVVLDDPEGIVESRTVSLVLSDGEHTETIELGELDEDGVLEDQVLWPGADIDDEGNATAWPGWKQEADGTWVETDGNFAWTRALTSAKFVVNPEVEVELAYPPATPDCIAAPPAPPGGETPSTPAGGTGDGLADTGFAGAPPAIVAGAVVVAGVGFLVIARLRRKQA